MRIEREVMNRFGKAADAARARGERVEALPEMEITFSEFIAMCLFLYQRTPFKTIYGIRFRVNFYK